MTEIRVVGNIIEDSQAGIVAKGTMGMRIENNTFKGVEMPIDVPKEDNPDVVVKSNEIK